MIQRIIYIFKEIIIFNELCMYSTNYLYIQHWTNILLHVQRFRNFLCILQNPRTTKLVQKFSTWFLGSSRKFFHKNVLRRPKALLRENFSCSLHFYIKQNRTFLITNLGNVNTKSCLRNRTRLCIHLLILSVPSCSLTHCFCGILLNQKISLYTILTSNVKINGIWMRHSKCNLQMI